MPVLVESEMNLGFGFPGDQEVGLQLKPEMGPTVEVIQTLDSVRWKSKPWADGPTKRYE